MNLQELKHANNLVATRLLHATKRDIIKFTREEAEMLSGILTACVAVLDVKEELPVTPKKGGSKKKTN